MGCFAAERKAATLCVRFSQSKDESSDPQPARDCRDAKAKLERLGSRATNIEMGFLCYGLMSAPPERPCDYIGDCADARVGSRVVRILVVIQTTTDGETAHFAASDLDIIEGLAQFYTHNVF